MAITLDHLLGRLLISLLFSSFSEVLSCSFDWTMFLCILILPSSLYLFLCVRYISFASQSSKRGLV